MTGLYDAQQMLVAATIAHRIEHLTHQGLLEYYPVRLTDAPKVKVEALEKTGRSELPTRLRRTLGKVTKGTGAASPDLELFGLAHSIPTDFVLSDAEDASLKDIVMEILEASPAGQPSLAARVVKALAPPAAARPPTPIQAPVVAPENSAPPSPEQRRQFVGQWALTLPNGGVGWLGITETNETLKGSVLWETGDVQPVSTYTVGEQHLQSVGDSPAERTDVLTVRSNVLTLVRAHDSTTAKAGKIVPVKEYETIRATRLGDWLRLTTEWRCEDRVFDQATLTAMRLPELPPAPDLAQVRFGPAIPLFNGRDLDGWRMAKPVQANGWAVQDGVLVNHCHRGPGQVFTAYGNLRTEREFEDYRLTCEARVPRNGNSGVFLRGIYEIQVADTFSQPLDAHSMGALYGRIAPSAKADKPAGEWQTLVITLVDRHVTVVLNGTNVIDNQPVLGCTGGALWADVLRPGPICLQGDHTDAEFRNLVIEPVVR